MRKMKMSIGKKRGIVLAAVLVMVVSAVFLNWRYSDEVAQSGKILGETTRVNGELSEGTETPEKSSYFATARLSRQQARDSAISLLEDAAAKEGAEQSVLNEASEGIQTIAAFTVAEAQIENLVTAKGYTDCVAFMSDESISVVVANGGVELSEQDVAKIMDIVMNETGYKAPQIKILESDEYNGCNFRNRMVNYHRNISGKEK